MVSGKIAKSGRFQTGIFWVHKKALKNANSDHYQKRRYFENDIFWKCLFDIGKNARILGAFIFLQNR